MSSIKEEIYEALDANETHWNPETVSALESIFKRHIEDAFDKGETLGHWRGRLAILNLPGCNYALGGYQTGAEDNLKRTLTKEEYLKSKGIC